MCVSLSSPLFYRPTRSTAAVAIVSLLLTYTDAITATNSPDNQEGPVIEDSSANHYQPVVVSVIRWRKDDNLTPPPSDREKKHPKLEVEGYLKAVEDPDVVGFPASKPAPGTPRLIF